VLLLTSSLAITVLKEHIPRIIVSLESYTVEKNSVAISFGVNTQFDWTISAIDSVMMQLVIRTVHASADHALCYI